MKKTIWVINGPNINMLGIREPNIYGYRTYKNLIKEIKKHAKEKNVKVKCFQSNYEGELVSIIQKAYFKKIDGIVINPAAYTHYSVAILDALKATNIDTIEVHISDVNNREDFRKISFVRSYVKECIKGPNCYIEAIDKLL